jgi:hypothetical protein
VQWKVSKYLYSEVKQLYKCWRGFNIKKRQMSEGLPFFLEETMLKPYTHHSPPSAVSLYLRKLLKTPDMHGNPLFVLPL